MVRMNTPKSSFPILIATFLLCFSFAAPVFAQNTLLPNPNDVAGVDEDGKKSISEYSEKDCLNIVNIFLANKDATEKLLSEGDDAQDLILGCAIKSGKIKFWMIPFFIRNILQFLINIAVLLCMLALMIGAYYYVIGGVTEDKKKGKTIFTYAIAGLVVTVLSWTVVNILLLFLTT